MSWQDLPIGPADLFLTEAIRFTDPWTED